VLGFFLAESLPMTAMATAATAIIARFRGFVTNAEKSDCPVVVSGPWVLVVEVAVSMGFCLMINVTVAECAFPPPDASIVTA
jgi:hypothetical protein